MRNPRATVVSAMLLWVIAVLKVATPTTLERGATDDNVDPSPIVTVRNLTLFVFFEIIAREF
jgi:hypothetical protein